MSKRTLESTCNNGYCSKRVRRRAGNTWDLTLGSDCAGMNMPRLALAGFQVRERFRSEINPSCRKLLSYVWPDVDVDCPDMSMRDVAKMPTVDLYIAGVPCQPWSHASRVEGSPSGLADPRGRLWKDALEYVREKKPKLVVFENVKGLQDVCHRPILNDILDSLTSSGYRCWHRVLNTMDHGIPQKRERLYIVAVRCDVGPRLEFFWPAPLRRCIPLKTLLAREGEKATPAFPPAELHNGRALRLVTKAVEAVLKNSPTFDLAARSLVVDIGCTNKFAHHTVDHFPTLTAGRASERGWWIVDLGRQVSTRDMALLQGLSTELPYAAAGVSAARMSHMLGNSMSLNVLGRLLPRALAMAGISPKDQRVADPWGQ